MTAFIVVEPEAKTSWSYIRSGTSDFQISPDWEKRRDLLIFLWGFWLARPLPQENTMAKSLDLETKPPMVTPAASKTIQFAKLSVQVLFGCLTCLILLNVYDLMIKVLQLFLFYRWEN